MLDPVLKAHQEGEKHLQEICEEIRRHFNLTEEEMQELIPSSRQTKVRYRVSWAKNHLSKAKLIKPTGRRGYSEITPKGLEVLKSQVTVDRKFLKQLAPAQEPKESHLERSDNQSEEAQIVDEEDYAPEEFFERNLNTINEFLSQELLARVHAETPQFFERLIVNLMLAMRYGGTEGVGKVIGGSGDEDVDGVIHQDALGVDKIYLQAKRYKSENKIKGEKIREFSGALRQKQVAKGIFVTTSSFTRNAENAAKDLNIILIDGRKLAELMIQYNVGCQVERTFELKKIDEDYFDSGA